MEIKESNFSDLFRNIEYGFPFTRARQHLIEDIEISKLKWTPFVGLKTLFLKGLAENKVNGHSYQPMILFKNVIYTNEGVSITAQDNGKIYHFQPIKKKSDILVRCPCKDFFWRFHREDHLDRSLYGKDRKPYIATTDRGPVNPMEVPGFCKHLIALYKTIENEGLLK